MRLRAALHVAFAGDDLQLARAIDLRPLVVDARYAAHRKRAGDGQARVTGEHRRRQPARHGGAQQIDPRQAGVHVGRDRTQRMDRVQRRHLDDQAAFDLRLPERRVPLPARRRLDAVATAKPDHRLDVFDGAGAQDRHGRVVNDVADVVRGGRQRRRISDQDTVQRRHTIERRTGPGVGAADPAPRPSVEAEHHRRPRPLQKHPTSRHDRLLRPASGATTRGARRAL
jgi:hypothetical protein